MKYTQVCVACVEIQFDIRYLTQTRKLLNVAIVVASSEVCIVDFNFNYYELRLRLQFQLKIYLMYEHVSHTHTHRISYCRI